MRNKVLFTLAIALLFFVAVSADVVVIEEVDRPAVMSHASTRVALPLPVVLQENNASVSSVNVSAENTSVESTNVTLIAAVESEGVSVENSSLVAQLNVSEAVPVSDVAQETALVSVNEPVNESVPVQPVIEPVAVSFPLINDSETVSVVETVDSPAQGLGLNHVPGHLRTPVPDTTPAAGSSKSVQPVPMENSSDAAPIVEQSSAPAANESISAPANESVPQENVPDIVRVPFGPVHNENESVPARVVDLPVEQSESEGANSAVPVVNESFVEPMVNVSNESLPQMSETSLPVAVNESNESVVQANDANSSVVNITELPAVFAADVRDAKGKVLVGRLSFIDPDSGNILAEKAFGGRGVQSLGELNISKRHVRVVVDLQTGPVKKIELENVSLADRVSSFVRIDDVPESADTSQSWAELYAIDPTAVNFTSAQVTVVAKGTSLFKCKDWDFDARLCVGNWARVRDDLIPGQAYSFELTAQDPAFGEIVATAAVHLDETGQFVSNIFDAVKSSDGVWSEAIPVNHSVRVTFEKNLSNGSVIDFVAWDNHTVSYVEVYVANTSIYVGRSGIADPAELQYITLENVPYPTDTFDLKVVKLYHNISKEVCSAQEPNCADESIAENDRAGLLEFDYIHDVTFTVGSGGVAVYTESGVAASRYRIWNSTTTSWSAELTDTVAASSPSLWTVLHANQKRTEFVMGMLDSNTNTSVEIYNGTNWTNFQSLSDLQPNTGQRSFDLAIEGSSGNALIVYEDNTATNDIVAYRTWNSTNWSSASVLNYSVSSPARWVKTVGRPGSNDIMVLVHTSNNNLTGILWNGTSFVNSTLFNISRTLNDVTEQVFDFEWEGVSGNGIVVYANSTTTYAYRGFNYTSKTWSSDAVFFALPSGAPNGMRLCHDPTSNYVGFVSQNTLDAGDFKIWNGTGVETSANITRDTAIEPNGAGAINLDCGFESLSGKGVFVYVQGQASLDQSYTTCTYNKTAWSNTSMSGCPTQVISSGNSIETLEAYPNPVTNEIMVGAYNIVEDLFYARWNSSNFTNVTSPALETSLECLNGQTQCGMFDWARTVSAPTVTTPSNQTVELGNDTMLIWNLQGEGGNYTVLRNGSLFVSSRSWTSGSNIVVLPNNYVLGTWNYTLVYTDTAGNSGTSSAFVTVVDNVHPSCSEVSGVAGTLLLANITINGNLSDWAGVLASSSNFIGDESVLQGDPDPVSTNDRDMLRAAFTYDNTNLYFYTERTTRGSRQVSFIVYIDYNLDGYMNASDKVVKFVWAGTGGTYDSDIYNYVPANASGDLMLGDGSKLLGSITNGTSLATGIPGGSSSGTELEVKVLWSDLGLAGPTALKFKVADALGSGTNLPSQIEDNVGNVTSSSNAFLLFEFDGAKSAANDSTVYYAHDIMNCGNVRQTIDLRNVSTQTWNATLFYPNGSVITDTNGNGLPDMTLNSSQYDIVVLKLDVPVTAAVGTVDVRNITANSTSGNKTVTDTTTIANIAISPKSRIFNGTQNMVMTLSYTVYNYQSFNDTILINASSLLNWNVSLKYPNGTAIGTRLSNMQPFESQDILLLITIPSNATVGQTDVTTITINSTVVVGRSDNATVNTTVKTRLTLTPDYNRTVTVGSTVFYGLNVTNNFNQTDPVNLTKTSTLGWAVTLFNTDFVTPISSLNVSGYGGVASFYAGVSVPSNASLGVSQITRVSANSSLTVSVQANATINSTPRGVLVFNDSARTSVATVFDVTYPGVNTTAYATAYYLTGISQVFFGWYDSNGTFVRNSGNISVAGDGTANDSLSMNTTSALGFWTLIVYDSSTNGEIARYVYLLRDLISPNVTLVSPIANSTFNVSQSIELAVNVTDNVGVSFVFANVTLPNGTIQQVNLTLNGTQKYNGSFTITNLTGQYNVTFFANDTSNNINSTTTTFFVGVDVVKPSVVLVSPIANATFNVSSTIELAVNVSDNVAVSFVFANVTFPNGTIQQVNLSLNGAPKYNGSFTIPSLAGQYNVTFIANDSSGNVNSTTTTFFVAVSGDVTKPNVTLVSPIANSSFNVSSTIELAVNVTDNVGVSFVFANVTLPNGTIQQVNLSLNGAPKYNGSFTIPLLLGQYNVTFVANDTSGNVNSTTTTFFVGTDGIPPNVTILSPTANASFRINESVNITANVTDTFGVGPVIVIITQPNGDNITLPMSNVGSLYNLSFTNLTQKGTYTILIVANDSAGNTNNSVTITFERVVFGPGTLFDVIDNNSRSYNYTQTILQNSSGIVTVLLNLTNETVRSFAVELYNSSSPFNVLRYASPTIDNYRFPQSFAVDFSDLNMSRTNVTLVGVGNVIYKCLNYTFSNLSCADGYAFVQDVVGGQTYTFTLNASDPGFGGQSPTNGTPDAGNYAPFGDGTSSVVNTFTSLQANDDVYFAARRNNGAGAQLDLNAFLNISYNLSNITSQGGTPSKMKNFTFLLEHCYNDDITGPFTCGGSAPGGTINNPLAVDVFNWTSGQYVRVGTYNGSSINEGNVTHVVLSGFSDFVNSSNGFVNIRYEVNVTITVNGNDAAFGADFAQLTVVFDNTPPNVTLIAPVQNSVFNVSQMIELAVNVTDNFGVSTVSANVTLPNGTVQVVSLALDGGIKYNASFTVPLVGLYNVTFFANDTVNNINASVRTNFTATAPSVVVVKVDSPDPVFRGGLLNYTINVTNTGSATAFNVTVFEGYPGNVTFVSSSPAATSGNNTFSLGNISAGASVLLNITVNVSRSVTNGSVLNNTVNVSFQNVFGNATNVSASQDTTVLGYPDIVTFKTDVPDPVLVNGTITYQIFVNNTGDVPAQNVTVFEGYPSGTVFNGSSPSPIVGNNVFSLGNLSIGQSKTINITVNVSSSLANGTVLNNSYNVTFFNATANATVSNSTTTTVLGTPSLVVVKVDSPDPVFRGGLLNYTINITNTGNGTAQNVTLTEGYPTGTVFVSSSPNATSGNNTFSLGDLLPNATFLVNITVRVNLNVTNGTVLTNNVNVSFQNAFNQSSTAMASDTTTVAGYPEIFVVKTDVPDPVVRGTLLNYTIVVNNSGDDAAFNVTVVDTYPGNVSFVNSSPNATSGNNTFVIGTLVPNASVQINITVNVSQIISNGSVINNTVNVSFTNGTAGNALAFASQGTTVIVDQAAPLVFALIPVQNTVFTGGSQTIEIAANVTDNVAVDRVNATVTFPNGTIQFLNLTRVGGTDKYNVSFVLPALIGAYNVSFSANDTNGNVNGSERTNFSLMAHAPPFIVFVSPTPANDTYANQNFVPINFTVSTDAPASVFLNFNGTITNFSWPVNSSANTTSLSFVASLTAQSHLITINENASSANLTVTFSLSIGTLNVSVNGNVVGTISTLDTSPKTFTNISQYLVVGTNNITYTPVVAVTSTVTNSNITYLPLTASFFKNQTALADGRYEYFAFANDTFGSSNVTENRTFTVDTVFPTVQFVAPTDASGILVSRRNIVVNVSANDTNLANITIFLFNASGGLVNSSTTTSSPNFVNFTNLPDGLYFFNATAFDLAGNRNATETRNVTLDTTPPSVIALIPPVNSSFNVTQVIEIAANVSDTNGVSVVFANVTLPNGTVQSLALSLATGTKYNTSFTIPLAGSYNVTFFANDTVNNINASEMTNFTTTAPSVVVVKVDSPDPVFRGGLLNYTINVTNTGSATAFNVTVFEGYPGNVTFVSSSPAPSSGNNVFILGNISAGSSSVINITVNVSRSVTNGSVLNNTVNVSFQNVFGNATNVSASQDTTVLGYPEIVTFKVATPTSVLPNSTLNYTIFVNNTGDIRADNVTVVEGYPGNVTFVNSSPAPTLGNNTFFLGNLSPGAGTTINITVTVSAGLANGTSLNNSYNVTFFNATANATVSNSTLTTVGQDSTPPRVVFVSPAPNALFFINDTVNISVNVTDDGGVDTVLATITKPNGENVTFQLNLSSAPFYEGLFDNLTQKGNYTIRIFANDTFGNLNNTETRVFTRVTVQGTILDVVNGSSMPIPFTETLLSNSSGILSVRLNITNHTIISVVIEGYNESSPFSVLHVLNQTLDLGRFRKTFALDGSDLNFTIGNVTVGAIGNTLYKCENFTISNATCNDGYEFVTNLTGGQPYVFSFNLTDPGFGDQSPDNGTPDAGNFTAFGDGFTSIMNTFTALQANDDVYFAVRRNNNAGQQLDLNAFMNISYNLSNLTSQGVTPQKMLNFSFLMEHCYNGDILGVFTCGGASSGGTIENPLAVDVFNWTSGQYVRIGTYNGSELNEGNVTNVVLAGFADFINSTNGFVNIRYAVNVTITVNGNDTAFGADFAQLTVTFDNVPPNVTNVSAVPSVVNLTQVVNISANVTDNIAVDSVFANITYPNGTSVLQQLTLISGTIYAALFNQTFAAGLYNVTIIANDTHGNVNATQGTSFTVNLIAAQILTTKIDAPDPVERGSLLNYTILVNNTGNATALNVTVLENYPAGTSFVSASPAPTSGNNTFALGNLSAGSVVFINITVNVSGALANGTILNNSYNVTFQNLTGGTVIVSNSTTTTVVGVPQLNIIKTDVPDPVLRGNLLSYTINVTNRGDDTAFNVTVVDTYPVGVVFVNASPAATSGNATFVLGNLSPNATAQINITVNVTAQNGTVLNNTALVSFLSRTGVNRTNTTSATTQVQGFPEIVTFKTDSPDPVLVNSTLNYQIVITNTGDDIARNVTVFESYPVGVVFVNASPAPTSGNTTFVLGNLSANQSTTVNITVFVPLGTLNGSTLNNSYNVTFANATGTVFTVSNSTLTTVLGVLTLTVIKTDSVDPVVRGSLLNYAINITNLDGLTAFNVTLVETYPNGTSFVNASPAPTSGNDTFVLGNLSASASRVVNITVNVSPLLANGTVLNNSVVVSFLNATGENNSVSTSELTTVIADRVPLIFLQFPANRTNTTNTSVLFGFNATDDISATMNCSLVVDGSVNKTNASVLNNTPSVFLVSGFAQGTHPWNVSCQDYSLNTNTSETREFTVDFTPPSFNSLIFTPNDTGSLDPNVTMTFFANVTDNFTAVDTVVLHIVFNGSIIANVTMSFNSSTGLFNATFVPLVPGNYSAFLTANDAVGNNGTSATINFTIELESTWERSPSTFGAISSVPNQNITLGTLTINNTGDFNLSFNLSSTFNDTFFNESSFNLSPGEVRFVEVTVTAPGTSGQFPLNITIAAGPNATPSSNITTAIIVVTDNAFLFAYFTILPASVTQGQGGIPIEATVKNIGVLNASNVTLNIVLPSDWVLTGGSLTGFFNLLEPNATESLPIFVAIPSTAITGLRDITTFADGFNESGASLAANNLTINTTERVLVIAAGGGGGGGGGGVGGGGVGVGGGQGIVPGPAPGTFKKTFLERAVLVTNATEEVVRGSTLFFPLNVTNVYNNSVMTNVTLAVEGELAPYVSWYPSILENILYGHTKAFDIEIAAPAYKEKSEVNVTFIITSTLESEGIQLYGNIPVAKKFYKTVVEYKTVRIIIHEVTLEEVSKLYTDVEKLYAIVLANQYPHVRADILHEELQNALAAKNDEDAVYLSNKLKSVLQRELDAGTLIQQVRVRIADARKKGLDVSETATILNLAINAFNNEDFDKAYTRAEEASRVNFVELERAFNLANFVARYWWALLLLSVLLAGLSYMAFQRIRMAYWAQQMGLLVREQLEVQKLIRDEQEKYFVEKKMSSGEYYRAMNQYSVRLSKIRGELSKLRGKRAELLSDRRALEVELAEREQLAGAVQALQERYFLQGKMSRKRYLMQIEDAKLLVAEIDEHIGVLKKRVEK